MMDIHPGPTDAEIDVQIVAEGGFTEFVKLAWEHVEPEDLIWNWHMTEICRALDEIARARFRGESTHLAICVPPGCSKSLIASVLWQAWVWTWWPQSRWVSCTYEQSLASDLSRISRDLVQSDWYQERWPLALTKDAESHWINEHGGSRRAVGVGGAITGKHGHFHIGDDLIKEQDSRLGSASMIADALGKGSSFWFVTMGTRKVAKAIARVLIGQRLGDDDPPGIAMRDHGYESLVFPARYELENPDPRDHRTEPGELLCEERCDDEGWKELEIQIGPRAARAQLQQDPPAAGGKILLAPWLEHRYDNLPSELQRTIIEKRIGVEQTWRMFWDMNFKGKEGHSRVAVVLVCRWHAKAWFADGEAQYGGIVMTLSMMRDWSARYPWVNDHRLEDAANAPAVQDLLDDEIPGINLESHGGGTLARTNASEGLWSAGSAMLPRSAAWMGGSDGFVAEHLGFDGSKRRPDDYVSVSSLALVNLFQGDGGEPAWVTAQKRIRGGR
jgi:hypothetical protein